MQARRYRNEPGRRSISRRGSSPSGFDTLRTSSTRSSGSPTKSSTTPTGSPPETQRARLEELRAQALGERQPDDPVLEAFQELRTEYGIADDEIDAFVDAMATDIETERYETYDDLESCMRGSAAAVGVMMTAIMESEDEAVALPPTRSNSAKPFS